MRIKILEDLNNIHITSESMERRGNLMEDLSRYYTLLKDPTRRKIIEILGVQEKIGFKELRESLGLGVGTVYYHLDMLSDFLEQDKQRKYRLNAKGQMLYRVLKEGSVPASLGISETISHRAAKWLFLSPLFALTVKPLKFLPISFAILILGAYGASIARLEPALFFYFEYSNRSPPSIAVLFIFNWIGLFLFAEALANILFKRFGNDLQLFTCIGLAALPLAAFPYIYVTVPTFLELLNLYSWELVENLRQVILIILQIWTLLLVSAAACYGKGLRLDKGIILGLTAMYLNIAILFILGRFT
ncbi:MAG: winged helix-turn-helix domain-containing protein [Candidatus Bathyarchaeota archaeon]|jgi:DNA-binding transcriptional ArsR family regulator|nr:winged helix-turn-helix transcriptional regulator [Candidatus Bathyarchaeota archaeon A05DMB-3]MDH7607125.1 winged helix-turn-helix domain-containing protein [Candidatus Bathyarchaeota archaeon]